MPGALFKEIVASSSSSFSNLRFFCEGEIESFFFFLFFFLSSLELSGLELSSFELSSLELASFFAFRFSFLVSCLPPLLPSPRSDVSI
jgi:hypothetical protein